MTDLETLTRLHSPLVWALLRECNDPSLWLTLPPATLQRAAVTFAQHGVPEDGILIDPLTGAPFV